MKHNTKQTVMKNKYLVTTINSLHNIILIRSLLCSISKKKGINFQVHFVTHSSVLSEVLSGY